MKRLLIILGALVLLGGLAAAQDMAGGAAVTPRPVQSGP